MHWTNAYPSRTGFWWFRRPETAKQLAKQAVVEVEVGSTGGPLTFQMPGDTSLYEIGSFTGVEWSNEPIPLVDVADQKRPAVSG